MKYILLLPLLMLYSCDGMYPKKEVVHIPTAIPIDVDSVVYGMTRGLSMPDSNRYFLISYKYRSKYTMAEGEGNITLVSDGFPSKPSIDSNIFLALPNKKSCYQGIIITSIFEFNNSGDFISYSNGLKDDVPAKNKNGCK